MVDIFFEIPERYNGLENNCNSIDIFVLAEILFSLLFRYNGILISYSGLVDRYSKYYTVITN